MKNEPPPKNSLCVRRNCTNKATTWKRVRREGLDEYDAVCDEHK